MKKIVALGFVFNLLAMFMASTVYAGFNQFAGKWKNFDLNSGGITTLSIYTRGNRVTVRAWGKCYPTDCDWGRVRAYAYGPNVSSNLFNSADAISAIFRTSSSLNMMIIHPLGNNRLRVEVLRHFTDKSRRTNYRSVYTFVRSERTVSR